MPFKHVSVESPKTDVESNGLGPGSPEGFMFMETDICAVRQCRGCDYMPIGYIYLSMFRSVGIRNDLTTVRSYRHLWISHEC